MFSSRTCHPRPRARFLTIATITAVALVFVVLTHAVPLQRTLSWPKEKRSDVLCGAAGWEDVVAFFLLNYVAPAATVRQFPGDTTKTQIWWTVCGLFFPFTGVYRACQAIANDRPCVTILLVTEGYNDGKISIGVSGGLEPPLFINHK